MRFGPLYAEVRELGLSSRGNRCFEIGIDRVGGLKFYYYDRSSRVNQDEEIGVDYLRLQGNENRGISLSLRRG